MLGNGLAARNTTGRRLLFSFTLRYSRIRLGRKGIATHPQSHHAKLLSVLPTNVDKSSEDYKDNAAHMGELVRRMSALHRKIEEGGPPKAREKHISRGKMLPRE